MINNIAYYPAQCALNSKPVLEAFLDSCKTAGITPVENSLDCDAVVIWSVLWNGRMHKNKQLYEHYRERNKPVIVIDVGALNRNITWKIAVNNITTQGYYGHTVNLDYDRPKKLGVELQEATTGDSILIAGQHNKSLQWEGMPSLEDYTINTVKQLRKHTDRNIVVRYHPRCQPFVPFHRFSILAQNNNLKNCSMETPQAIVNTYDSFNLEFNYHAVVNYCSGPGINAVIAGTNVIVDPKSLAYPMSIKYKQLENTPRKRNRDRWLVEICHTEYTVDEIEEGLWLTRLQNALE